MRARSLRAASGGFVWPDNLLCLGKFSDFASNQIKTRKTIPDVLRTTLALVDGRRTWSENQRTYCRMQEFGVSHAHKAGVGFGLQY